MFIPLNKTEIFSTQRTSRKISLNKGGNSDSLFVRTARLAVAGGRLRISRSANAHLSVVHGNHQ